MVDAGKQAKNVGLAEEKEGGQAEVEEDQWEPLEEQGTG